jgi:DNA-binding transcriptional LysR family regulator
MVPTPKAQSLLPEVRAGIELLRGLIDRGRAFEPAASSLRFRLAASDFTQLLLMPRLRQRMAQEAPGCAVDIMPTHILRVEEALGTGEIDLAIAYFPQPPLSLRRSPLLLDRYVCIAQNGHPGVGPDTRYLLDLQQRIRSDHHGHDWQDPAAA